MISISIQKVKFIQEKYKDEIRDQYDKVLVKLKSLTPSKFDLEEREYLKKIIQLFENNPDILVATPDQFSNFKKIVGPVPTEEIIEKNKKKTVKKSIKDIILKQLDYTGLRTSFYPKYFAAIGIKTCVYCNSQLTVSVLSKAKNFSGRFDVDHYYSKHDYPWMSISLFNLYPACAPCNRRKSFNTVDFQLYSNDIGHLSKSGFTFKLEPYAKAKYLLSKDYDGIAFTFTEPDYSDEKKSFEETFKISSIYNTQLDIVEELIIKSRMYDDTYRKVLSNNFSKLGISPVTYQRTILGNYVSPKEIHKRPMSKFMQDIARDLGLIE